MKTKGGMTLDKGACIHHGTCSAINVLHSLTLTLMKRPIPFYKTQTINKISRYVDKMVTVRIGGGSYDRNVFVGTEKE
jgi:hypothetical protein